MTRLIPLLLALFLVPFAGATDAAEPEKTRWIGGIQVKAIDSDDPGIGPDEREIASLIGYRSKTTGSIDFVCSKEEGLEAFIFLEPRPQNTTLRYDVSTVTRTIKIAIGDEKPFSVRTNYLRTEKVHTPRKSSPPKRLYNAAIQGKPVRINTRMGQWVTLTFPPMNDAMRNFARECHVTNPG